MDPPPSQISRAWSVWSYVTEAVGRFLRPVEVTDNDGQEPEESNAKINVRAEGAEETQSAPITSSVENIPQSTVTWEECDSNNGVGPVKENIKYIVQFTRGSDSHSLESDECETEEIADTGLHVAKEMSTEEEEVENDGKQHFIVKVTGTLKTDENEERDHFGSSKLTHVAVSDNMEETNGNSGLEETGGIMPHDGRQKVSETLKNVQVKDWNEGEEVFIEDETQDLKDACTVRCSGSEDYAGQLCTLVCPEKDSNIYREDLALARPEKCRGKEHDAAIKKETERNTSVSEQASALSDSDDENDLTSDEELVEHGGGDETQDLKDACTVRCSGSEDYTGQLCTLVSPEKDSNIYREDLALARQEKCRGKEHDAAIKKEKERNTSVSEEQASALSDSEDENDLTSDEELVEHGGGDETQDLKDACTVRCSGSEDYAGQLCTLVSPEKDSNIYREDLALARQEKCRGKEHDAAIKKETERNTSVPEQASTLYDDENNLTSDEELVEHGGGDIQETVLICEEILDKNSDVTASEAAQVAQQKTTYNNRAVASDHDTVGVQVQMMDERLQKTENNDANDLNTTEDRSIAVEREQCVEIKAQIDDKEKEMTKSNILDCGCEAEDIADDDMSTDHIQVSEPITENMEIQLNRTQYEGGNQDCTTAQLGTVTQTTENVAAENQSMELSVMSEHVDHLTVTDGKALLTEINIQVDEEKTRPDKDKVSSSEEDIVHKTESAVTPIAVKHESNNGGEITGNLTHVTLSDNMEEINRNSGLEEIGRMMAHDERQNVDIQVKDGNEGEEGLFEDEKQSLKDACTVLRSGSEENSSQLYMSASPEKDSNIYREDVALLRQEEEEGRGMEHETVVRKDTERHTSESEQSSMSDSEDENDFTSDEGLVEHGGADVQEAVLLCEEILDENSDVTASEAAQDIQLQITYNKRAAASDHDITVGVQVQMMDERLQKTENNDANDLNTTEDRSIAVEREQCVEIKAQIDDKEEEITKSNVLDFGFEAESSADDDMSTEHIQVSEPIRENMEIQLNRAQYEGGNQDCIEAQQGTVSQTTENVAAENQSMELSVMSEHIDHLTVTDGKAQLTTEINIPVDEEKTRPSSEEDIVHTKESAVTPIAVKNESNNGGEITVNLTHVTLIDNSEEVALLRQEEEEGRGMEHETVVGKETERHTSESEQSSTLLDSEDENDLTSDEGLVEHGRPDDQEAVLLCEKIFDASLEPSVMSEHVDNLTVTDRNAQLTETNIPVDEEKTRPDKDMVSSSEEDIVHKTESAVTPIAVKHESNNGGEITGNLTHVTLSDNMEEINRNSGLEGIGRMMAHDERQNVDIQVKDGNEGEEGLFEDEKLSLKDACTVLRLGSEENSSQLYMSASPEKDSNIYREDVALLRQEEEEGRGMEHETVVRKDTERHTSESEQSSMSDSEDENDFTSDEGLVEHGGADVQEAVLLCEEILDENSDVTASEAAQDIQLQITYNKRAAASDHDITVGVQVQMMDERLQKTENNDANDLNTTEDRSIAVEREQCVEIKAQIDDKEEEITESNVLDFGFEAESSADDDMSTEHIQVSEPIRENMEIQLNRAQYEGGNQDCIEAQQGTVSQTTENIAAENQSMELSVMSEHIDHLTVTDGKAQLTTEINIPVDEEKTRPSSEEDIVHTKESAVTPIAVKNESNNGGEITVNLTHVTLIDNSEEVALLRQEEEEGRGMEHETVVGKETERHTSESEQSSTLLDSEDENDLTSDEGLVEHGRPDDQEAVLLCEEIFDASLEPSVMSEHVDNLTVTDRNAQLTETNIPVDEEKTRPDKDMVSSSEEDIVHKTESAVTPIAVKHESNNGGEITGNLTHVTLSDNMEEINRNSGLEEIGRMMAHDERQNVDIQVKDGNEGEEGLFEDEKLSLKDACTVLRLGSEENSSQLYMSASPEKDSNIYREDVALLRQEEEEGRGMEHETVVRKDTERHTSESEQSSMSDSEDENDFTSDEGLVEHGGADVQEAVLLCEEILDENSDVTASEAAQDIQLQITYNKRAAASDHDITVGVQVQMMDERLQKTENNDANDLNTTEDRSIAVEREQCVEIKAQIDDKEEEITESNVLDFGFEAESSAEDDMSTEHIQVSEPIRENMEIQLNRAQYEGGNQDCIEAQQGTVSQTTENVAAENQSMELSVMSEHIDHLTVTDGKAQLTTEINIPVDEEKTRPDEDEVSSSEEDIVHTKESAVTPIAVKNESNNGGEITVNLTHVTLIDNSEEVALLRQEEEEGRGMEHETVVGKETERHTSESEQSSTLSDSEDENDLTSDEGLVEHGRTDYQEAVLLCEEILDVSLEPSVMSEHVDNLTVTDRNAQLTETNIPVDEEKTRPDKDMVSSSEEDIVLKTESAVTTIAIKNESNNGGEITGNRTHVTLSDNMEELNRNSGLEEEIGEIMAHDERQNVDIQVKDGNEGEEVLFENETQSLKDACTVLGAGSEENSGQLYMLVSPEKDSNIYREDVALLRQEEEEGRGMEHETVVGKETERHTSESEQSSTLSDSEDENDLTSDEGLVEHGGADVQEAVLLCEEIIDENSDVTASEAAQDTQLQITYNKRAAASDHDITVGVQVQMMDERFQKTENNDANYLNTTEDGSIAVEMEQCVEIKAQIDDKEEEMTESNVLDFGFEAKSSADDDMSTDHIQVSEPITENMEIQLNGAQYEGGNQDCTAVLLGTVTQTTENVPAKNQSMELSVMSEHIDNLTVTDGKAQLTEINIPVDEEKTRPDEDEVSSSEEDIVHKKESAVTPIAVKNESNNGGEITGNLTHVTLSDNMEETNRNSGLEEEIGEIMAHDERQNVDIQVKDGIKGEEVLFENETQSLKDARTVLRSVSEENSGQLYTSASPEKDSNICREDVALLRQEEEEGRGMEHETVVGKETERHTTESSTLSDSEDENDLTSDEGLVEHGRTDNQEAVLLYEEILDENSDVTASEAEEDIQLQMTYNKRAAASDHDITVGVKVQMMDERLQKTENNDANDLNMTVSPEKDINIYREDGALLRQEEEEGGADAQEAVLFCEEIFDENSVVTASEAAQDTQQKITYNKRAAVSDHDITDGAQVMCDTLLKTENNDANDLNKTEDGCIELERDQCVEINAQMDDKEKEITMGIILDCHFEAESSAGDDMGTEHIQVSEHMTENMEIQLNRAQYEGRNQDSIAAMLGTVTQTTENVSVENQSTELTGISHLTVTDGKAHLTDLNIADDEEETRPGENASGSDKNESALTPITVKTESNNGGEIMGVLRNTSPEISDWPVVVPLKLNSVVCEETQEGVPEYDNNELYEDTTQRILEVGDYEEIQTSQLPEEVGSKELESLIRTVGNGEAGHLFIHTDEQSSKLESALHIENMFDMVAEGHTGTLCLTDTELPREKEEPSTETIKDETPTAYISTAEFGPVDASLETGTRHSEHVSETDASSQDERETDTELLVKTEELLAEKNNEPDRKKGPVTGTQNNTTIEENLDELSEETVKFPEAELHTVKVTGFVYQPIDPTVFEENICQTISLSESIVETRMMEQPTRPILNEEKETQSMAMDVQDAGLNMQEIACPGIKKTTAEKENSSIINLQKMETTTSKTTDGEENALFAGSETDIDIKVNPEQLLESIEINYDMFKKQHCTHMERAVDVGFYNKSLDIKSEPELITLQEKEITRHEKADKVTELVGGDVRGMGGQHETDDEINYMWTETVLCKDTDNTEPQFIRKPTKKEPEESEHDPQRDIVTQPSGQDGEMSKLTEKEPQRVSINNEEPDTELALRSETEILKTSPLVESGYTAVGQFPREGASAENENAVLKLSGAEVFQAIHETADSMSEFAISALSVKSPEIEDGDMKGADETQESCVQEDWSTHTIHMQTGFLNNIYDATTVSSEAREDELAYQSQENGETDIVKLMGTETELQVIDPEMSDSDLQEKTNWEISKGMEEDISQTKTCALFQGEAVNTEDKPFGAIALNVTEEMKEVNSGKAYKSQEAESEVLGKRSEPVTEYYLHKNTCLEGQDQLCGVPEALSGRKAAASPVELSTADDAEELATSLPTPGDQLELDFRRRRRIAIKNHHALPQKDPHALVQIPSVEPTPPKPSGHLPMKGLTAEPMGGLDTGIKLPARRRRTNALRRPGRGSSPAGSVLKKTNVSREENSTEDSSQKKTETKVNDVSPGPVVVLEGRTLTESDLHKKTYLEGQDQVCDVLDNAHSGRKAASSPVELSTADDAEELATPLPTPGDQLELDFTPQKTRIAIKNPHVRPPKDPRALVQMPSVEPTPPKPSGHLPMKGLTAVPMGGLGMGIKLPGFGAGFPVLKKTNVSRQEEKRTQDCLQKETETQLEVNDVSPGPVVVLEGRILTESDLHKKTRLEGQDQVCDVLDNAHSVRKAASSPVELSTADNAEELATPLPTPGDQLEFNALDFTPQKTRIAIKNPHVRPPKDPRALLQMPSVEPTLSKPSGHLPMKGLTAVPMGGLGIGIKLPGFGAGFPVLKKTNMSREENRTEDSPQTRIDIKNPHVRPPKDPCALVQMPSVEPTPPKTSGHLPMKGHTAVPMGGLGMGIKLPGFGAGFPVLKKTNVSREENRTQDCLQKETETKLEVNDVSPGPVVVLEGRILTESDLHKKTCLEGQDQVCDVLDKAHSVRKAASSPVELSTADNAEELATPLPTPGDQLEFNALDFTPQKTRIAIKNPHVRPPKDPRALLQMPSVEPTLSKPSGHLPMKGLTAVPMGGLGIGIKLPGFGAGFPVLKKTNMSREENRTEDSPQMPSVEPTPPKTSGHLPMKGHTAVPMGGLGMGIKLPGFGAGFPVLKKTNVSREENRIQDCLQKETETKLEVNDVSPGPVVVLEGRILTESDLHKKTRLEGQDQVCDVLDKAHSVRKAASSPVELSTADNAEELATPLPTPGDQLEFNALDFTPQKTRIAIKNPHVRPPKDPRALLQMPSVEPTLSKPSARLPMKRLAGVPMGGLGVGIKLPGFGADFPVLKKTNVSRVENLTGDCPQIETETKQEVNYGSPRQDVAEHKPKWMPPRQPGFGNPLMSELKNKLKKTTKE